MRFCVVLMLGLTACAITLTDEERTECSSADDVGACEIKLLETKKADAQYRREDKDTQYRDQFYKDAAICKAGGGTIWIERHNSCYGRECPPRWGDTYGCGPRSIGLY